MASHADSQFRVIGTRSQVRNSLLIANSFDTTGNTTSSDTQQNANNDGTQQSIHNEAANAAQNEQEQATIAPTTSETQTRRKTKKQLAKERGKALFEKLQEKRLRGELKEPKKPQTKSQKSGIYFNVNSILKKLKKKNPRCRVLETSAVLLAGVLEYLTAEVLELSGSVAHQFKRQQIKPRHIFLAIENDQELHKMLGQVTIAESGVLPNIHPDLLRTPADVLKDRKKRIREQQQREAQGEKEHSQENEEESEANQSQTNDEEKNEEEPPSPRKRVKRV
jgi:histone H2A